MKFKLRPDRNDRRGNFAAGGCDNVIGSIRRCIADERGILAVVENKELIETVGDTLKTFGYRIIFIDPYDFYHSARINPIESTDDISFARAMADVIVESVKDPSDEEKILKMESILISSFILMVGDINLPTIYKLLIGTYGRNIFGYGKGSAPIEALDCIFAYEKRRSPESAAVYLYDTFKSDPEKEYIISDLAAKLGALASPALRYILEETDPDIKKCMTEKTAVFLMDHGNANDFIFDSCMFYLSGIFDQEELEKMNDKIFGHVFLASNILPKREIISEKEVIFSKTPYTVSAINSERDLERYTGQSKINDDDDDLLSEFDIIDDENADAGNKNVVTEKREEHTSPEKRRVLHRSPDLKIFDLKSEQKPVFEKKLMPTDIKSELDKYVIGQENVKKAISMAIFRQRMNYSMARDRNFKVPDKHDGRVILIIGPTGSGKTLIAETAAKAAGLKSAVFDASQLTADGWKGMDKADMFSELRKKCDSDKEAEYGIIIMDEFDKFVGAGSKITDGSNYSIKDQNSILGILEGIPVSTDDKYDKSRTYLTGHNLFILTGSFPEIEEYRKKKTAHRIGFAAEDPVQESEDIRKELVDVGMIPELAGRISMIVFTNELTEEEMMKAIFDVKGSSISEYAAILEKSGKKLFVEKGYIKSVIKKGKKDGLGVRGIRNLILEDLDKKTYEAFECGLNTVVLNTDHKEDPDRKGRNQARKYQDNNISFTLRK